MLELKNISKTFPGVTALNDVSVEFKAGEIHGLLGENGAGKSTLIKVITGVHKAEKGEIFFQGKRYNVKDPFEALSKGISVVYQDFQLIPEISVAENIMLNKFPRKGKLGFLDWKKLNQNAQKCLREVGLKIDPRKEVCDLSASQMKMVQVARAFASDNIKILFLDEPTASITPDLTDNLFELMNMLKEDGVSIIFVTHILEEVLEISDRITVLRDGNHINTSENKDITRTELVKFMIGRAEKTKPFGNLNVKDNKKIMRVRNLNAKERARNVCFDLYKGEILGLYGLVGAGRTELAKILIGEDDYDDGEIIIHDEKAEISSPYEALEKYGLGYVTEDRQNEGLVLNHSVKKNITTTIWDKIAGSFNFVSDKKEKILAQQQVKDLEIKIKGLEETVETLSGGNKQKVSIAKWMVADINIFIFDEPTVGIDVGAREAIHKLIWELANDGKSIILISSDMKEIVRLSERILVFSQKRICGEVDNGKKNYDIISEKIGDCLEEFKVKGAV